MLTQARKTRGVSAKVDGVLQTSMQKKHHFQKILVPAKDNQIVRFKHRKKPNRVNSRGEKTIQYDGFNIENAFSPKKT